MAPNTQPTDGRSAAAKKGRFARFSWRFSNARRFRMTFKNQLLRYCGPALRRLVVRPVLSWYMLAYASILNSDGMSRRAERFPRFQGPGPNRQ